jgi:hypothetical protein
MVDLSNQKSQVYQRDKMASTLIKSYSKSMLIFLSVQVFEL